MAGTLGEMVRTRLPRLVAALRAAGDLDEAQAVEAIVEYRDFGITDELACPAVAALGGQLEAIRHAIRHRHLARSGSPSKSAPAA